MPKLTLSRVRTFHISCRHFFMQSDYLSGLNEAQLRAVQHPPNIPLQILAGPGSGKTKVLTARIAHLISHHALSPSAICAVTFTNKAANEMRQRLTLLIGKDETSQIRMGTFHALCANFLRRHATLVGIERNFTVCDTDESKKIIKKLLEPYKDEFSKCNVNVKEETVLSFISKAKASGRSAADLMDLHLKLGSLEKTTNSQAKSSSSSDSNSAYMDGVVAQVYEEYEDILRENNSLDFDDLLVYGVKLFSGHRNVGEWCKHVLVDEFQDTNIIQYNLMTHIASANRCITVVGDPDQSIYGWRSAEVENLARMQRDFPKTQQILLEQNYRSTASILAASMAIVAQDKTRIAKTLRTSHPDGLIPTLQSFSYEYAEAASIAGEIKNLIASTGGMLGWGDFVILLRFNALSRSIESALQREGIPNRVLAGHKFFERAEVKAVLAYLQLIDNEHFGPAFIRAINTPSRGIGEKTISELLAIAEKMQISPLGVTERIHDGRMSDIKPAVKRKLTAFISVIRELRDLAKRNMAPADLIRRLLDLIDYREHLEKTQQDWESRWDNVEELINFATEVEASQTLKRSASHSESGFSDEEWDTPEEFDRDQYEDDGFIQTDRRAALSLNGKGKARDVDESHEDTPLRLFLQASMLSSDNAENQSSDQNQGKVTISTCHAAKGLEWPVVMIPAVEEGTFPSHRAEDIDEERRLLYVACTRAQGLLYLSYSTSRMVSGESKPKKLSHFLRSIRDNQPSLFTDRPPQLTEAHRAILAGLLGRLPPDEAEVAHRLRQLNRSSKPASENGTSRSESNRPSGRGQSSESGHPVIKVGFRSAKETLQTGFQVRPTSSSASTHGPLLPSRDRALNASAAPTQASTIKLSHTKSGHSAPSSSSSEASREDRLNPPYLAPSSTSAIPAKPASSRDHNKHPHEPEAQPPNAASRSSSSGASSVTAEGPALVTRPNLDGVPPAKGKRRLGMTQRVGEGGYKNKKFKVPGNGK